MFHAAHCAVRAAIGVSALAVVVASGPNVQAQKGAAPAQPGSGVTPNYELAAAWTALTMITRIPYDAQHLPFTQVRFIKSDAAFEFEVQVPRDAVIPTTKPKATTTDQQVAAAMTMTSRPMNSTWTGTHCCKGNRVQQQQQGQGGRGAGAAGGRGGAASRTRTLHFEYDMATARVLLVEDYPEEPRRPAWGSLSPDGKTVLFARNHNLYMIDAANWEKAQKSANDKTIVEHQLTTDGEEHYRFGGGGRGGGGQQQQQQEQQDEGQNRPSRRSRVWTPRTSASGPATSCGPQTRASLPWCAAIRGW